MVALLCVGLSIIAGLGGFMLKYLMRSSGTLGRIESSIGDQERRIGVVEDWQRDRDAELVAYRNGYQQKWQTR